MSDVLKVGLVCEGPTDRIVINAATASLLGDRDFLLVQLQPEDSLAFGATGTGWAGVYRWCRQAADQGGGSLRGNALFEFYDVLILHIDVDVTSRTYESGNIVTSRSDLPCPPRPCPPFSDSADLLRGVVLGWIGEGAIPPRAVFCTPSKSTEAWVLAALFPTDPVVLSGMLECHPAPANLISAKPIGERLKKTVRSYQERAGAITQDWARVRRLCSEAERFSTDFLAEIPIAA